MRAWGRKSWPQGSLSHLLPPSGRSESGPHPPLPCTTKWVPGPRYNYEVGMVGRLASALLDREISFCPPRFLPSRVAFRSLVAFLEHNPPPMLTQKSSSERLEYQLPPRLP